MACSPCEAAARARARERLKRRADKAMPWIIGGAVVVLYLVAKGTGAAIGTAVGGAQQNGGAA